MKTLSFVKQAMAVALLISAANASAMDYVTSVGKGAYGLGCKVATADESAAQFALRKALGVDSSKPFFGGNSVFRDKNWTGIWNKGKAGKPEIKDQGGNVTQPAVAAVPGAWSTKQGEEGKPYLRYALGVIENHRVAATRVARVAKVAVYAAIAYGLYKWYTAKPEVEAEVQPEAQPEVVVETTQAEVEAPVKVVRQQPVA